MKKLICLIAALGLAVSVSIIAAPKPDKKAPAQQVSIYSKPSTSSKVIKAFPGLFVLVLINPADITISWITHFDPIFIFFEDFNKIGIRVHLFNDFRAG